MINILGNPQFKIAQQIWKRLKSTQLIIIFLGGNKLIQFGGIITKIFVIKLEEVKFQIIAHLIVEGANNFWRKIIIPWDNY